MSNIGAETSVIEEFIADVCASSAAITGEVGTRIYSELAPASAVYPFIVYQIQSSTDTYVVGPNRLLVDAEILVRGISAVSSYAPLKPLAVAIDSAFDGATGTVDGAEVSVIRRLRPFSMLEEYEHGQIRHLGGLYRVWAQGA